MASSNNTRAMYGACVMTGSRALRRSADSSVALVQQKQIIIYVSYSSISTRGTLRKVGGNLSSPRSCGCSRGRDTPPSRLLRQATIMPI